jgi:hypothetical protein
MRRALAVLVVAASSCTCGVPGVSNDTYVCHADGDCVTGQKCIAERCRPLGSVACAKVDCGDPGCDGMSCGTNGKICIGLVCNCSGNGGAQQIVERACADLADNDCDGLTDCADSDCNGLQCSQGGMCNNGMCLCAAAGNLPQAVETYCNDGLDNDCDGLTDCADPSCDKLACDLNGKTCVADAGVCGCSGKGGVPETTETHCDDGFDNDCNGNTDCADQACNTHDCMPHGYKCMGVVCMCTGNGGFPQTPNETSCTDTFDNDCDGLTDCADPDCDGAACGSGCNCVRGMKTETACTDGLDNDGNGQTDCADTGCGGAPCGANGLVCSMGACRCFLDGGTVQAMEMVCNDGLDNDCNGKTDCQETACAGKSCGVGGMVCGDAGTCICPGGGGTPEPTETSCGDGFDNDCDGLTDCADPDCSAKPCNSAQPAAVCCGTGASAGCRNLATDAANCGGCGLACRGGNCQAASASGTPSGHCTCGGPDKCPITGQSCQNGTCDCQGAAECAPAQQCSANVCRYP